MWEEGDRITLVAADEQVAPSSAIPIESDAVVRRVIGYFYNG